MKDKIGDDLRARNSAWNFKGSVAKNFHNHIARSIPFYINGQELVTQISDFFIKEDSICYELGCSTGALTNMLAKRHISKKKARFVGIDIEKDMIRQANKKKSKSNVKFVCGDAAKFKLKKSDLIVSYYTTQFIRPSERQIFFKKIFSALKWGGAFILFEKVRARDARFQDMTTGLYNEFKLDNGYSPTEIFNKTRSLKGVLEPFSTKGNCELLDRAGFKDYMTIFKYICFSGFLAIK
tara:strand:+ start:45 stop:758 length:714 start_codon:yes stop_codon:yes gene_type:complete